MDKQIRAEMLLRVAEECDWLMRKYKADPMFQAKNWLSLIFGDFIQNVK